MRVIATEDATTLTFDPNQPATVLTVPDPEVIASVQASWQYVKKQGDVLLVIDVSGSMEGQKIDQVREAAADAWKRLLSVSLETEVRLELKQAADTEAIRVFTENLRELLLAAVARGNRGWVRTLIEGGALLEGGAGGLDVGGPADLFTGGAQVGVSLVPSFERDSAGVVHVSISKNASIWPRTRLMAGVGAFDLVSVGAARAVDHQPAREFQRRLGGQVVIGALDDEDEVYRRTFALGRGTAFPFFGDSNGHGVR